MTSSLDAAPIFEKVQALWAEAFGRQDWASLAALYTDDAQLFGGKANLFTSREGVRRYFDALPSGAALTAKVGAQHVIQVAPDVVVSAGEVYFCRAGALAEPRPHRITLVLANREGQWLIASHHASPKP